MRAIKQWQYSLMGSDGTNGSGGTNWNRLNVAGIGLENSFVESPAFPVARIPWLALPAYQAGKLDADPGANFNIALFKGGIWPFARAGNCPLQYASTWPHDEQMVGIWKNTNTKRSPFLNNNISVMIRCMLKKTMTISLEGVDQLNNEGRLLANFKIFKQSGELCAEVQVCDDVRRLNWGYVMDALKDKCSIGMLDMQWYQFVPTPSKYSPLQGHYHMGHRAVHLANIFPQMARMFSFCHLMHPLTLSDTENATPEPLPKAGARSTTASRQREDTSEETSRKAAKTEEVGSSLKKPAATTCD